MDANLVKQVDDHGDQFGINDCLHLLLVSCCDVGQEPHRLLQDKERKHKRTMFVIGWDSRATSRDCETVGWCLWLSWIRTQRSSQRADLWSRPSAAGGEGVTRGSNHRPVTKKASFVYVTVLRCTPISAGMFQHPFLHQPMVSHKHTHTHSNPFPPTP